MLGQDHGLLCVTAHGRIRGRRRDRGREPLVRELGGQRQVEGPKFLVGGDLRQLQVKRAPVPRPRARLRRGGEEWMCRAHAVTLELDDPGVDRVLEHRLVGNRREPGHAKIGIERECQQQPANRPAELRYARSQQVFDGLR